MNYLPRLGSLLALALVVAGCGEPEPAAQPAPDEVLPVETIVTPSTQQAAPVPSTQIGEPAPGRLLEVFPGLPMPDGFPVVEGVSSLIPADLKKADGLAWSSVIGGTYQEYFFVGADGSWGSFNPQDLCLTVYDAPSLRLAGLCPISQHSQQVTVVDSIGVPSATNYTVRDVYPWDSNGLFLRARARAANNQSGGIASESFISSDDLLEIEITADLGTGLTRRYAHSGVSESGDSAEKIEELASLGLLEEVPDTKALVEWIASQPGDTNYSYDHDFRAVDLDELAGLTPYNPVHLGDRAPGGLELAAAYFAKKPLEQEGQDVAIFVYRQGLEYLVITNRRVDQINGTTATAGDWADPVDFVRRSHGDSPSEAKVEFGKPQGTFSPIIADIDIPPHSWGIVGNAVVTVEGNVEPALLLAATKILAETG